jgi:hypothetical protein
MMHLLLSLSLQSQISNLWENSTFHYKDRVEVTGGWYLGCRGTIEDYYIDGDYDVAIKVTQQCKPESRLTRLNRTQLKPLK